MQLTIIPRTDGFTQVALSGRLDAMGVQSVGTRFQNATAALGKPTIIDLTDLEFVASLGLGLLLSSARALHKKGARAVIVN
ncbi:MAG TPA: STAS domain-containing protein, partial [Candidatus Krumholzibacteria bacterium]|nr:STAS domain-containing protein [Candidatus Krumholzibacteria bacterium]